MDEQSASSYRARTSTAISVCVLIAVAAPGFSTAATAGGLELDSREYKLMLEPDKFTGADPLKAVERFTTEQLVPALREQWNHDADGELTKKGMQIGERRVIRFWDSGDCLLYRNGFAWRGRTEIDEHGKRANELELTLKFRSPDAFLAAGMPVSAKDDAKKVDSKLEEDLGPVAVRGGPGEGVAANPRSVRSQSRGPRSRPSPATRCRAPSPGLPAFTRHSMMGFERWRATYRCPRRWSQAPSSESWSTRAQSST